MSQRDKIIFSCWETFSNYMTASLVTSKIMEALMKLVTKCAFKTFPSYMIVPLVNSKIMEDVINLITKICN